MSDLQKDTMKLMAAALVILIAIAALDSCIRVEPTIEAPTPLLVSDTCEQEE